MATSRLKHIPPWDFLIVVVLTLVVIVHFIASWSTLKAGLVDDSFIFQRVADNIWNGEGWTYNTDERVNPITAPFYVLLLTAARALGLPAEAAISAVYIGGAAIFCVGLYFVALPFGRVAAATAALCIATAATVVRPWGMETSVFLACLVAGVWALSSGRVWLTGLICGVAALCRPEGAALLGVSMLAFLWRDRRFAWQALLGFFFVVSPWMIFSFIQFDEFLPNSVAVKSIQSRIGWFKSQPSWAEYFFKQPAHPIPTFLMAAVGVMTATSMLKKRALAALALFSFCAIQVAAYSTRGAPVGYFWYLAPGLMAIDLAAIVGSFNSCKLITNRLSSALASPAAARLLHWLGPAIAVAVATQLISRPFAGVVPYRLGSEYAEIGTWIDANTSKDGIVAATEIGYIGYYSKRNIRDIHGLLHPEAIPYLLKEEWAWWFHDPMPEVIIVHSPPWHGEPSTALGWTGQELSSFNASFCRVKSTGRVAVYQKRASAKQCLPTGSG